MIQQQSKINVADNTGAKKILIIRNLSSRSLFFSIGDIVFATVKSASTSGALRKGDKVKAVIVRTKHPIRRANGTTIRFGENAAVIISNNRQPKGTRIFGAVPIELKKKKFDKIVSLVSEVI